MLDFLMAYIAELGCFWYVLSDKSIGIFYGSFLPRGIWICEVDRHAEFLGYHLMACKLRPVVSGYGFYVLLVWLKQPHHVFREFSGILAMLELPHEEHACVPLHDSEYGAMVPLSDNRVHLKVPEAFSIGLFRPFTNAGPIGDGNALAADGPAAVFEPVATVFIEVAALSLILPYHLVDGLMGYVLALELEIA